jgi:transposase-like protein
MALFLILHRRASFFSTAHCGRRPVGGHRNGHRDRQVMGTFGSITVSVPRARIEAADGKTSEWHSKTLPAYQRRTKEIDAVIAGSYLAGTNTRRVGRALAALFRGSVSKDTVSRTWRKIKGDWDAWNARDLSKEEMVRLILDGTVVRVRVDRKATAISLLVVLGVRGDGQKVLLSVRNMGGESEAAWRTMLDDLVERGLQEPELAIVDGAPGLEKALASLWSDLPMQRCTVHKLRNLIAHAPKRLAEEVASDFSDMIYARWQRVAKPLFANGGSNAAPLPTAWRKPASSCSPSRGCRTRNGRARAQQTRSSGCMRSSSGASRRRRCYPPERRPRCCSGRCSRPGRSDYGRSMDGARWTERSLSRLTSPHNAIRWILPESAIR